jgi:hypothetical protein
MSNNVVKPERPQMTIWRCVACWISKTTHANTGPPVHISNHTHTRTHALTDTKIPYTYCFSTATMVSRTLLNITRSFKYDRDYLCVNKSQFVPVIFEPPCILHVYSWIVFLPILVHNRRLVYFQCSPPVANLFFHKIFIFKKENYFTQFIFAPKDDTSPSEGFRQKLWLSHKVPHKSSKTTALHHNRYKCKRNSLQLSSLRLLGIGETGLYTAPHHLYTVNITPRCVYTWLCTPNTYSCPTVDFPS